MAHQFDVHDTLLYLARIAHRPARSSLLLYCNNPKLKATSLLSYMASYPQRRRLLLLTEINLGYRCGHLHALSLTAAIWSRFVTVISLSGPDVLLTPPAISRIASSLTPSPPAATSKSATSADFSRTATAATDGAVAAKASIGSSALLLDLFVRYGKRLAFSMDRVVFRTDLVSAGAWANATAHCLSDRQHVPEGTLQWLVESHHFSHDIIGRRAFGSRLHALNPDGLWHAHNMSAVRQYLEQHEQSGR